MAKKRPKFSAIFDTFRLWSQISPQRLSDIRYPKYCDRQRFLSRSVKKVRWTLVHKQKSFIGYWLTLSHPSGFFGGYYISAL